MKQRVYILLVFIFGLSSCINNDVDNLVNSIAKKNIIECESIGIAGSKSNLYKKFERIKSNASKDELLKLINHDSLAVVGYSSYALIDKKLINC